jgi:hypothetical protein
MGNLFKKSKSAVKSYVGSVKGDANAIGTGLKDKFGSGKSISNTFDQRISDGLDDLLTGVTGIRTSKIPEVSAERISALEKNREARAQKLNTAGRERAHKAEGDPPAAFMMKYPTVFPDENSKGGNLQNYIHFRSLERRNAGPNEEVFDIFLYVPEASDDAVSVTYKEETKGIMESMMAKFMGRGQGGTDQGIGDQIKQGFLDAVGGSVRKAATGRVANPMKFMLFEGVGIRTFSYEFALYPETADDSKLIRSICYAFKKSALPGVVPDSAGRVYTFPNEWAIRYHGPMKDWIDYPMVSVLTDVKVDYGKEKNNRMIDGAPAAVGLSLSFSELMTLDREKYDGRVSAQTNHGKTTREHSQEGGSLDDLLGLAAGRQEKEKEAADAKKE